MDVLETSCYEEQNAKRTTKIGALVQKLCPFEFLSILCHDWIISPQPHIRNS
jgi:hypothetical protein